MKCAPALFFLTIFPHSANSGQSGLDSYQAFCCFSAPEDENSKNAEKKGLFLPSFLICFIQSIYINRLFQVLKECLSYVFTVSCLSVALPVGDASH
jgi:hypothetical protein